MKKSIRLAVVLFAAFTLNIQPAAQADTFGTSGNAFTINFASIGNAGNAADTTTSYGAVPYEYRMGEWEISQNFITKATASGMATNKETLCWSRSRQRCGSVAGRRMRPTGLVVTSSPYFFLAPIGRSMMP